MGLNRRRGRRIAYLLAAVAVSTPLAFASSAGSATDGFQTGDLFVYKFAVGPGTVSWFRADGSHVQDLASSLSAVTGTEADPSGRLWVSGMADNKVVVFDANGVLQGPIVDPFDPDCGEPTDIGFDSSGNAYIGDFGTCVDPSRPFMGPKKFDSNGTYLATLVPQSEADFLDLASDLCTLYWQDSNGETIYKRDICTNGPRQFVFSLGLGEPRGMRLLPDGSLLSVERELVVRVAGGSVVQEYDLPDCNWDGLALSVDASSFWSSCVHADRTRTPHEFDVSSGSVLRTLPGVDGVVGTVYGGWRAALQRFAFSGFFEPLANPPALNKMRAGRDVAVSFSLGGDQGLDIFAEGSPTSHQVRCDESAPIHNVRDTMHARSSTLTYDPSTDRYTYIFKTYPAWAKRCRDLVLRLRDGSEHTVHFLLK